ncbi:hypothetical protein SDC9_128313 [bioreactor metagenome]|uniref:Uncharacterized protein n=1 Tax=bioreactor metagenome TaxID=1076179 RepID=A0A645CWH3_9ZZZZ
MKSQLKVAQNLVDARLPDGCDPEEVVNLPQRDEHRDAAGKAGDHRSRDISREPPELEHARKHKHDPRQEGGNEHALHGVFRNDGNENRRHSARRPRNLVKRAGQPADDRARDDGRNQPRGGVRPAGNAERQRQRQRYGGNRQPRQNVLDQFCPVVT